VVWEDACCGRTCFALGDLLEFGDHFNADPARSRAGLVDPHAFAALEIVLPGLVGRGKEVGAGVEV
jgi:hypothetical protein